MSTETVKVVVCVGDNTCLCIFCQNNASKSSVFSRKHVLVDFQEFLVHISLILEYCFKLNVQKGGLGPRGC